MTKSVLFLLDKLQWLFRLLKVDYRSLRSIVEVKMMMENRRSHGINKQNFKKEDSNTFIKSLGFQALFSFLFGLMILLVDKNIYNIYIWNFSFIMFMIAFNMISDFVEVLFDTTDNIILIPRPVNSKVIWMARLIHIIVFLSLLTFANSLGSIVFTIYKLGFVAGIIYFISLICLCLITVFFTGILYLLLTKFVSGERLKDIIGYAQIAFTVILMVGYQVGTKMSSSIFQVQTIVIKWWHFIAPPVWFAGLMESCLNHHFEIPYLVFILLILITPFLSIFLMNRYLSPLFSKSLSEYGTPEVIEKQANTVSKTGFLTLLSEKITKNPLEKAAFNFVWKITNRDRKFKIRAYPIFGMVLYFMSKLFTDDNKNESFNKWTILYYTSFCVYAVIQQIFYSDDWKAAWIYKNSPIETPGNIILGGVKALIVKIMIPSFIILGAIMVYKFGNGIIKDVVFAFINTLLFIGFTLYISKYPMPFSKAIADQSKAGKNWSRIILLMFIVPLIGFFHYLISLTTYGVMVIAPIILIIALILLSEFRKVSWEKITE
jgi:ABC-2 type transport system permease protein